MNERVLENRVNRDPGQANKDLATLENDSVTGLSRKFEQLTDGIKEVVDVG